MALRVGNPGACWLNAVEAVLVWAGPGNPKVFLPGDETPRAWGSAGLRGGEGVPLAPDLARWPQRCVPMLVVAGGARGGRRAEYSPAGGVCPMELVAGSDLTLPHC